MGAERGGLHEEALGTQSAVDLIGGHLQILLALFPSLGVGVVPSLLGALQQVDGAHHVALDEDLGVLDGAVNMALGGEVDDIVEIVLCKQALDQLLVADVALHKDVAGVALNVLQVLKVAGIGQLVEVDQQNFRVLLEHIMHEVGTDKTGTAGDKIFFHNDIFLSVLFFFSGLALSVTFGDSSPKGGATGVSAKPFLTEQSFFYRKPQCSAVWIYSSWPLSQGPAASAQSDLRRPALPARHASGSPSGRAGREAA